MVERSPEKAGVGGSTPSLATIFFNHLQAALPVTWSPIGHVWSQFIDQTAESFHSSLLTFWYELLVHVECRARPERLCFSRGHRPLLIDLAGVNERIPALKRELKLSCDFERFDD